MRLFTKTVSNTSIAAILRVKLPRLSPLHNVVARSLLLLVLPAAPTPSATVRILPSPVPASHLDLLGELLAISSLQCQLREQVHIRLLPQLPLLPKHPMRPRRRPLQLHPWLSTIHSNYLMLR